MLNAVNAQASAPRRPVTPLLQRLADRPLAGSDTLVLSNRCMPAGPTTPLPANDDLTWKGKKPVVTADQRRDIAAMEAHQRTMLAEAIKGDAGIMGALKAWPTLKEAEKLAVLRRIAALEGEVFHFTPAPMTLNRKAKQGDYGAYDGDTRKIELGAWGLKGKQPRELVDTVIHEQLHALQHQRYTAMRAGRLNNHNPQYAQAQEWLYNSTHYHEFEKGKHAYRHQPVEAHAWDGAGAIVKEIFGK